MQPIRVNPAENYASQTFTSVLGYRSEDVEEDSTGIFEFLGDSEWRRDSTDTAVRDVIFEGTDLIPDWLDGAERLISAAAEGNLDFEEATIIVTSEGVGWSIGKVAEGAVQWICNAGVALVVAKSAGTAAPAAPKAWVGCGVAGVAAGSLVGSGASSATENILRREPAIITTPTGCGKVIATG